MKCKIGALYINTDRITFAHQSKYGIEVYFGTGKSMILNNDDPNYQTVLDVLKADFIDLSPIEGARREIVK